MALSIVQNCYVVRDVVATATRLNAIYGIGPFLGGDPWELTGHSYRGEPAPPITVKAAFAQAGELNIELVEVVSDEKSAFRDMFAPGEEGLHHVAIFSDDPGAERLRLEGLGYPVASEFATEAGTMTFLDARAALGHMIELYSDDPIFRNIYAATRSATENWDGQVLFQPLF